MQFPPVVRNNGLVTLLRILIPFLVVGAAVLYTFYWN